MIKKKLLFGLLVTALMFVFAVPNTLATNSYTNNDETGEVSDYNVDTMYEAGTYVAPVEIYNVDLEWDDLHWIFIYSGDIKNPTSQVWMTKVQYDIYRNGQDSNTFNLAILNNINQYRNHDEVQISVVNYSLFPITVTAEIEPVSNANYTNAAVLQVISENNLNWNSSQATISGLSKDNSSYFKVKPQSSRFVNDDGTTVSVTGELKLTFTKS